MYIPNPETKQTMTPFELKALAFADLIMKEAAEDEYPNNVSDLPNEEENIKEVPPFKAIRCICGDNQPSSRELILCPVCHCYLHRDCIDPVEIGSSNFKCQFCRLMYDGNDPFRDLKIWIGNVDSELRSVHKLVTEALNYENQMYPSNIGNEYQIQGVRGARQGNVQSRNQINRTVSEIITRLKNITKL